MSSTPQTRKLTLLAIEWIVNSCGSYMSGTIPCHVLSYFLCRSLFMYPSVEIASNKAGNLQLLSTWNVVENMCDDLRCSKARNLHKSLIIIACYIHSLCSQSKFAMTSERKANNLTCKLYSRMLHIIRKVTYDLFYFS